MGGRMSMVLACMGLSVFCTSCGREKHPSEAGELSGKLIVFHAGSLSVPLREASLQFTKKHPLVTILAESAGSRDTARKVCDLGRCCDVLGAADYQVVENLLMPEYATFNIRMLTNEMVLAYTDESARSRDISERNWCEILLEDGVHFGRSDPNRDPCGYRTIMVLQLAEKHYDKPGLAEAIQARHGMKYIRPKETELLALLEAGEIDYFLIYRSVAAQHGLKFLELPEEINLGSPDKEDTYKDASVRITGKTPGELITRVGMPIVYSFTIPRTARNRKVAEEYLAFLLSPQGCSIMEKNGHGVLRPALVSNLAELPERLKACCR